MIWKSIIFKYILLKFLLINLKVLKSQNKKIKIKLSAEKKR